jgi:hypothetical protein
LKSPNTKLVDHLSRSNFCKGSTMFCSTI